MLKVPLGWRNIESGFSCIWLKKVVFVHPLLNSGLWCCLLTLCPLLLVYHTDHCKVDHNNAMAASRAKKLSQLLINLVNASPLLEGAGVNEVMNVVSTDWTYSLALVDMIGTLNDLGTFAMETIESIGAQRPQPLSYNLSKCMVNLIEGIEAMTAERDSSNEAAEENLSLALSHELVNCMVLSL